MRNTTERNNNRQAYYDDREERAPSRGRPYGSGRRRDEEEEQQLVRTGEREAAPAQMPPAMDLTEWTVAQRIRVQHITVTIWQRQGRSERPVYSLTLTRTFQSRRGYLTTNKLFASDAPLAAEAFRLAEEWLQQGGTEDPLPF